MDVGDDLARGRDSYAKRAWLDAHTRLALADRAEPLAAEDLELLATSAYMLGHADEYFDVMDRGDHAHLEAGEAVRAARCAIWLGLNLAQAGEMGRASGWLGRAQRLIDREKRDCVEQGYLLLPLAFQHEAGGEYAAAASVLAEAAAVGERFGDADLFALAVHEQGHLTVKQGRIEEGLRLLDEAMVAVTTGELSPLVSGIVYCGVILGCQDAYEVQRAREWTAALTQWCEKQPDMVAFTGRCLVHRSEILQLQGEWPQALEEALQAMDRCAQGKNEIAAAESIYRQAEIHRLRGEFARAADAYRDASQRGWEPQPGLALLRLAQGEKDIAAAAIRRALGETTERPKRAGLLPAYVEIMLAVGDVAEARSACIELEEISAGYGRSMLAAMAAQALGAVDLAEGDPGAALVALRRAWQSWQEYEAPYEAARARVLVGLACRELGDFDAGTMELEAARGVFTELGAAPDLTRVDSLLGSSAPRDVHDLTPRELQVLRLVAAGETNRAIAVELVLSERTVDRHVSNIFNKFGVSSRAAATAHAYEHKLL